MRELKYRAFNGVSFKYSDKTILINTYDQLRLFFQNCVTNFDKVDQYTGLLDKNGVEIYEGDICIHAYESDIKGVISFFEGSFIIGIAICSNSLINFNAPRNLQVIGNIHQNPELLK